MLNKALDYFFDYSKGATYVSRDEKPGDVPFQLAWILRRRNSRPEIYWFRDNSDYFKVRNDSSIEFLAAVNGKKDYIMKDDEYLGRLLRDL